MTNKKLDKFIADSTDEYTNILNILIGIDDDDHKIYAKDIATHITNNISPPEHNLHSITKYTEEELKEATGDSISSYNPKTIQTLKDDATTKFTTLNNNSSYSKSRSGKLTKGARNQLISKSQQIYTINKKRFDSIPNIILLLIENTTKTKTLEEQDDLNARIRKLIDKRFDYLKKIIEAETFLSLLSNITYSNMG